MTRSRWGGSALSISHREGPRSELQWASVPAAKGLELLRTPGACFLHYLPRLSRRRRHFTTAPTPFLSVF